MFLSQDSSFVGSTHGDNETQHGNRVDLDITESLNKTFGRSINFHHALHKFFPGCSPTMKVTIRANHCSNMFGVSNNLHVTKLFASLRDPRPQRIMLFVAKELNAGKIGSMAIAKRKPLARQPCRTPLAIRNCLRDAVPLHTSQEATEKSKHPSVLKHREDPRVSDTGICSGEVSQKDT